MKRFTKTPVWIAATLVIAVAIRAETQVDVGGNIRLRGQADDRSFDTIGTVDQFFEMRTRLTVEALIEDNVSAVIQAQDSRVAGGTDQFGRPTSGTLNDGKNIDLHQAYIQIDNIFSEGWGGKAGRFEFVRGNHRVFGNVGWDNVGRSWEGSMLWYDNPDFRVTGFWLKGRELMSSSFNRDFDVFGLYGNIRSVPDGQIDLFGVYEYDADTIGYGPGINKLDRISVGTYFRKEVDHIDFEGNGVYQFGTMPSRSPLAPFDTVKTELDIAAFMFAAEIGYSFDGYGNARVAAGIDYASGDDGTDSTKFKAYNNLYYTGHKFRGYMDYFTSSNFSGLMDLMLRGRIDPTPGWTVKGDVHYFSTAQDYADPLDTTGTTMTKDVGIEVDVTVSTTRIAGVRLDAGGSVFLPKEAFAGFENPDPGLWGWFMATAEFGN